MHCSWVKNFQSTKQLETTQSSNLEGEPYKSKAKKRGSQKRFIWPQLIARLSAFGYLFYL